MLQETGLQKYNVSPWFKNVIYHGPNSEYIRKIGALCPEISLLRHPQRYLQIQVSSGVVFYRLFRGPFVSRVK